GEAKPLFWPSPSAAFEPSKQSAYSFDLDRSAALLKQAGVSEFELDVLILNVWPQLVEFAPIYQADLAKVGVKLNIRPMELGLWVDEVVNRRYKGLYLTNATFGQLEPSSTLLS